MKRLFPPLLAAFILLSALFPTNAIASTSIVHTVIRGDTLYSLSRRYGTTVDAIMQVNHLNETIIYIGQELTITSAAPPINGNIYTVVRHDTLYSIARRYGTTVDAIMRANNLYSTLIYVDQQLLIGQTILPTSTPQPTPTSTPMPLTPTPTASTTPLVCDPSYPDFCLQPGLADLDCGNALLGGRENFTVLPPDPHGFDADNDGIGCESN